MSDEASKADPLARRLALVPVALIVAAVVAYMWGFRVEGRRTETLGWRTHTVAEHAFAVQAPGMLVINQQTMNFEGADAPAKTYIASDMGADLSVTAVRRPDSDVRPFAEVAKSLGLIGTDATARADGGTMFRYDITVDGKRTLAMLIFQDRMMYQLMVTSLAASFPETDAERFFSSFRLTKT